MKRLQSTISRAGRALALTMFALVGFVAASVDAEAKVPGKTYCYNRICHYVKTIAETSRDVGRKNWVNASYYDDAKHDRFNPSNVTSSGEYFRAWAPDNAASPVYPNGTKLMVWHPKTGKAVLVRVNNSGPYYGNRLLDLSKAAAERIGMTKSGVKSLQIAVVSAPTPEEARYKKGRSYAPVRGYMGTYASLDQAMGRLDESVPHIRRASKPAAKRAA